MPGNLNQRSLGDKPDHFALRDDHTFLSCAGSNRFKRDMERRDDVIGEIHGHLNHLSTG
jgi:hypothetical protein